MIQDVSLPEEDELTPHVLREGEQLPVGYIQVHQERIVPSRSDYEIIKITDKLLKRYGIKSHEQFGKVLKAIQTLVKDENQPVRVVIAKFYPAVLPKDDPKPHLPWGDNWPPTPRRRWWDPRTWWS